MTRWLRVLSMLSGFALLPAIGHAATIAPADTTGLRSFNGGVNVLLLGFTAVKDVLPSGQEDRTVAHFDLGVLSGTIPTTTLEIPVYGIDPGDPTGIFEVYAFAGDGIVSIDEWAEGRLFHTFDGLESEVQTLSVDVTALVQLAVDRSLPFLSFNFRSLEDRYNMGDGVGLPDASLVIAPEPATASLLGGAMMALALLRARRVF